MILQDETDENCELGPKQLEVKAFLSTESKLCMMCMLVPCICAAPAPVVQLKPKVLEQQQVIELPEVNEEEQRPPTLVSVDDVQNNNRQALLASEIASVIKPHQITGVSFLQQALEQDKGALLADFMGLGKTLQVLATVFSYIVQHNDQSGVLILCPTICVHNWANEFTKWFAKGSQAACPLYTLSAGSSDSKAGVHTKRLERLKEWKKTGGVLIMGYEMYRLLLSPTQRRPQPLKMFTNLSTDGIELSIPKTDSSTETSSVFAQLLVNPGPDLIVLDEGHRIKDPVSVLRQLLSETKTRKRIVLTGYPVQNCLTEYWSMIDFARPGFLGTYDQFREEIELPIVNAKTSAIVQKLTEELALKLKPMVLRRSGALLKDQLPPKHEWVVYCKLSKLQRDLYLAYLRTRESTAGNSDLLSAYSMLLHVVNHPAILHRIMNNVTPVEDTPDQEWQATYKPGGNKLDSYRETQMRNRLKWSNECLMNENATNDVESSGKMAALRQIIETSIETGDKVLVFSQSIGTLESVALMLKDMYNSPVPEVKAKQSTRRDPANMNKRRRLKRHKVVPVKTCQSVYLQIDGSTSNAKRMARIKVESILFNNSFLTTIVEI